MANIDHYHGDEMRHMKLLQGHPFDVLHHIFHAESKYGIENLFFF